SPCSAGQRNALPLRRGVFFCPRMSPAAVAKRLFILKKKANSGRMRAICCRSEHGLRNVFTRFRMTLRSVLFRRKFVVSNGAVNESRRRFLVGSTSLVGAVGAVGAAVPFVASWNPSDRALAAGAPVTVDISRLEEGALL